MHICIYECMHMEVCEWICIRRSEWNSLSRAHSAAHRTHRPIHFIRYQAHILSDRITDKSKYEHLSRSRRLITHTRYVSMRARVCSSMNLIFSILHFANSAIGSSTAEHSTHAYSTDIRNSLMTTKWQQCVWARAQIHSEWRAMVKWTTTR